MDRTQTPFSANEEPSQAVRESSETDSTTNFDSISRDINQHNDSDATKLVLQHTTIIQSTQEKVEMLDANNQLHAYKDAAQQSIEDIRKYIYNTEYHSVMQNSENYLKEVAHKINDIIYNLQNNTTTSTVNYNVINFFIMLFDGIGPISGSTQYCNYQDNILYLEIIGHIIMEYPL